MTIYLISEEAQQRDEQVSSNIGVVQSDYRSICPHGPDDPKTRDNERNKLIVIL